MERSKLLSIAVIGLLLLNFGILGFMFIHKENHHFPGGRPPGGDEPKRIIIERLHFDVGQQQQYEALISIHRKHTHELNDASHQMHEELFALLAIDSSQTQNAEVIILKIAENQKEIDHLNYDHFSDIKKLCKPDQIKDFDNLARELAEIFAPKGPPPPPPH